MLVPTNRFWLLVGLGIPIALLGLAVPGFERLLIPYNVVLFAALFITWRAARDWDFLKVDRRIDPILSVRQPNQVALEVANTSDQPLTVWLREGPPETASTTETDFRTTLEPGRPQVFRYTVTPTQRGAESFTATHARWLAPLGLAWVQRPLTNQQEARIYPNVLQVREYDLLKQRGHLNLMGVRRSRIKGLGTEFESLRDYNEDDVRTIDWKASARRGKLVVKNFEQERNQALIVCYDIGRHMLSDVDGATKLDHTLDAGLMLLHAAERKGDQIGLLVFNDLVRRYIKPKKGRAQVAAILEAIHGLHAEAIQSDHERAISYLTSRWKRRSLIVIFTDAENADEADALNAALSPISKRHLIMVVRVRDPRLRDIAATEVKDAPSFFERASLQLYQEERHQAESKMQAMGLQSVEAEPDELTGALLSAYLRVKELSLI